MRFLIDQDGTISDWGYEWDDVLETFGPAGAAIPRHADQRTFNLLEGRTREEAQIVAAVMAHEGFYARLRPIPGAHEALNAMLDAGHDVRIVTSPWLPNRTCASDKLAWVEEHYGTEWASRVIITGDKTLIRGDYLIDDKPTITGVETPEWEHIWYSQPYNAALTGKRRITSWDEWETALA